MGVGRYYVRLSEGHLQSTSLRQQPQFHAGTKFFSVLLLPKLGRNEFNGNRLVAAVIVIVLAGCDDMKRSVRILGRVS